MNDFNNSVGAFVPGLNQTITIDGNGNPLNAIYLGTDDGYFTVTDNPEFRLITYTGFYAFASQEARLQSGIAVGNPSERRAAAELYITQLIESLGGIHTITALRNGENSFISVPSPDATPGTLYNPYTYNTHASQSNLDYFKNCYLTSASQTDEGIYYFEFTLEFTQPKYLQSGAMDGLVEYKGIPIGNTGGFWNISSIDPYKTTYQITSYYNGNNAGSYLATLANDLELEPLESVELPLASTNNRTAFLSCTNLPGTLERFKYILGVRTSQETVTAAYLTSLSGRLSDTGILTLTSTFEKSR